LSVGTAISLKCPTDLEDIKKLGDDLATIPDHQSVSSDQEVTNISEELKGFKRLKAEAEEAKRAAIQPLDDVRKKAKTALDEAIANKKVIAEPYAKVINECKRLDKTGRDCITNYTEEIRFKKEQELKAMSDALEDAANTMDQAQELAKQAKITGDEELFNAACDNKEAADAKLEEYRDLEASLSDDPNITGIGISNYIDYSIDDVAQVPDSFIDFLPDVSKIQKEF